MPGCRLPHVWLEEGRSTLDLVGTAHTVIATPGTELDELTDAAKERGMPLDTHRVDVAVLGSLGADWVVVRPDQVVAAVGSADRPPDRDLADLLTGHSVTADSGAWSA